MTKKTSSRHQGIWHSPVFIEKGHQKLFRMIKQNRHQTVIQLIDQYNAGPGTSVSKHTVL